MESHMAIPELRSNMMMSTALSSPVRNDDLIREVNKPRPVRLEWAVTIVLFIITGSITALLLCSIVFPLIWHKYAWAYDSVLSLCAVFAFFVAMYVFQIGWGSFQWTRKYRLKKDTDWYNEWRQKKKENGDQVKEWSDIQHFVIVTAYKEPDEMMRLLAYTLMSQKADNMCKHQITLVLAFEEREGQEGKRKAERLQNDLHHYFRDILVTYHPPDTPGDIKGKASNYKYAAGQVDEYIQRQSNLKNLKDDMCLIHVADADSLYDPNYFPNVTYEFCVDPKRYSYVWQPCMIPTCNFWDLAAPCRQINVMIAAQEMMSAHDPCEFQIPFSTYGLALFTLRQISVTGSAGGAQDADVIAEDHHMFIKGFIALEGHLSVRPIFLPCLNFAVGGDEQPLVRNIHDRFVQAKRHMFGVSELIYFIGLLIRGRLCCRRTLGFRGGVRTVNLFFKLVKIHSIPYIGLWVAMGGILIGILKLQKGFCEQHPQQNQTNDVVKKVCDKHLSGVAETFGAWVFSVTTTITFTGSVVLILSFTRMLKATHHTLQNIGDPSGSFMPQNIWVSSSPRRAAAQTPFMGDGSVIDDESTCDSERASELSIDDDIRRAPEVRNRPVRMGSGFPWFGTMLQLVAEFAVLGLFTSIGFGAVPAIIAMYILLTKGHRMDYVTAPKPGSGGAPDAATSREPGTVNIADTP